MVGGFIFRIGIGALPFLLPLLLQLGFGLSPFAVRLADLCDRGGRAFDEVHRLDHSALARLPQRALIAGAPDFRRLHGLLLASSPSTTAHWLIFLALLSGGFVRSLEFTALNAISYADIDSAADEPGDELRQRVAADVWRGRRRGRRCLCIQADPGFGLGDQTLVSRDLSIAFVLVAIISSSAVLVFARLAPDAGSAVSGKITPSEQEHAAAAAE